MPDLSSDGRRIVYVSDASGTQDLYIMPDGQVLFLSDRAHSGGTSLYFMASDGSGVHLSVIL